MRARVPLDVDLQDRLIYGLTPARFGCLAAGALLAFGCWSALPVPEPVRLAAAALAAALGAALAWGRWRGQTFDSWLLAALLYSWRNYRLELQFRLLRWAWRTLRGQPRRLAGWLPRALAWPARAGLWLIRPFRQAAASLARALRWLVEPQSA